MKTPKELGITKKQFNNLFKLAHYLLEGKLKTEFDIRSWHSCGIGHAILIGIAKEREHALEKLGVSDMPSVYNFLFVSFWGTEQIDNTAKGCGQRILYFLEHELPVWWHGNLGLSSYREAVSLYSGIRLVHKTHSTRKSK